MLAPSSVMLTEPFGRPLMEEVRGAPGVCTPGSVSTSCRASRVAKGSSLIWRPVIVVETLDDLRLRDDRALRVCDDSGQAARRRDLRDGDRHKRQHCKQGQAGAT